MSNNFFWFIFGFISKIAKTVSRILKLELPFLSIILIFTYFNCQNTLGFPLNLNIKLKVKFSCQHFPQNLISWFYFINFILLTFFDKTDKLTYYKVATNFSFLFFWKSLKIIQTNKQLKKINQKEKVKPKNWQNLSKLILNTNFKLLKKLTKKYVQTKNRNS